MKSDWKRFRIITEDIDDAESAVNELRHMIDRKGSCSVNDLFNVCYQFQESGTTPESNDPKDSRIGWKDKDFAEVEWDTEYVKIVKDPVALV